ncbi:TonB-dependent receptor [Sphingobium sp. LB126]|uniref:TonB-dependent receptor n=1 Tax=Sphingobium sp. LB126 TaxID=1983755 RepID=UPI0012FD9C6E|nr:TonB-dependent receptor [Sphingobium sp. LB126]
MISAAAQAQTTSGTKQHAILPAEQSTTDSASTSDVAASSTQGLEEIVVTAQKRSENLQRVPIAVTSLSANRIQTANITSTVQLAAVSPGVNIELVNANFQPRIRGVGTSSQGPGVENPVALYVDGVYYASQQFGPGDLSDVQSLNVLKGPQGTLFGRNATGGVIQINTRDPSRTFNGELEARLDSYLTSRIFGYVSGSLTDDVQAGLSIAYAKQFDGWGENLADGKDVHRADNDLNVRSKFFFEPTSSTTIKLLFDYAHRDGTNGLNFRPYPGTKPLLPGYRQGGSKWDIDNAQAGDLRFDGGGAALTIEQDVGFAQLVSTTSYRRYSSFTNFAASMVPQPAQIIDISRSGNQETEELQLLSKASSKLKWVFGVFGIRSSETVDPLSVKLFGPLAPAPDSLALIDISAKTVAKSIAVFGQSSYEVLPRLNFTAGLRYTYEHRSFTGGETGMLNNGFDLGALPIPAVPPTVSFNNVSWRLALDYQLTPSTLLYASNNRGFKSGGYNGLDPTNPPYLPERLDAYEAGMKTELFDRQLRLNVAGFYYNYQNIQVSRFLQTATIYNGGQAHLYGVDIDVDAKLGAFTIEGGLEYLHNKFTRFPDAQFSVPQPNGGSLITSGDAAGNHLPFASTFSGNLSLTYTTALAGGDLALNVNGSHNSGYWLEPDNILKQPDYDLLGASIRWAPSNARYTLRLWATNLLNKAVIGFIASSALGSETDYSNQPRTFGGTLTIKFR